MENENEMMRSLKLLTDISLKKEEIQTVEGISSDVEFLLIDSLELQKSQRFDECVATLQAVLDITWEELNTGHWSLVPDCHRVVYSIASLLKVIVLVQRAIKCWGDMGNRLLEEAVRAADMGLLLGSSHRDQLTLAAHVLSQAIGKSQPKVGRVCQPTCEDDIPKLQILADPIPTLHCPPLETFSAQHFYPRKPVKITGCMHHWPALRRWPDLDYLVAAAGSRTVPVELGSSYTQAEWSQRLMTLRDFITRHVTRAGPSSDEGIGYLAQHQLFDQVPELRKDIVVPDYCGCSDGEGEGDVDVNAWFGPAGTVSPLHHDPKHNLLCQVVGRKRVVLYPPSDSDNLYPHEGRLLSNTSKVDPEAPDYKLYPKYRDTQASVCLLSPGEMLYIPPMWWHHVRALHLSFSVSFWWT